MQVIETQALKNLIYYALTSSGKIELNWDSAMAEMMKAFDGAVSSLVDEGFIHKNGPMIRLVTPPGALPNCTTLTPDLKQAVEVEP